MVLKMAEDDEWDKWWLDILANFSVFLWEWIMETLMIFVLSYSKWRTTPVVEEVFAEVSAQVAAVVAVDAAEAVVGAAVPGAASPRTRK